MTRGLITVVGAEPLEYWTLGLGVFFVVDGAGHTLGITWDQVIELAKAGGLDRELLLMQWQYEIESRKNGT